MKKSGSIVFLFLGMILPDFLVFSQVKIFIEPEYNFFKPLGRINKGIIGNALIQPVEFNLPIELGFSTSIRINSHNFKVGYRLVQTGLNWKIRTPQEYVNKAIGTYNSSLASSSRVYSNQYHFSHSYLFKTKTFIPLYKLDNNDPSQKFLFRFSWFSIVGASLECSFNSYEQPVFEFSNTGNIFIQERIENKLLRRNNYSIFAGGGIQFFHNSKERLKVSLVYSQGLFKFYEFPITVTFDGKTQYDGLMSTRGSFIGLFVSYPFLVWSNKRMLKKRGVISIPETQNAK